MLRFSIKTKVTFTATAFSLLLLLVIGSLLVNHVKGDMKQLLADQQLTLVRSVADSVDQRIADTHEELISVAKSIPPGLVGDQDRLQAYLAALPALQSTFDGIFVVSRDGVTVVDLPVLGRRGLSAKDLEHFRRTVAERKPVISRPFLSPLRQQPTIAMTAPIFGPDGKLAAVLTGSLQLLQNSFLARIADAKVGKTGAFAVLGLDRSIVISQDKKRIMTAGPAPGESPYFDHAMVASEGSEEAVNSRGLHAVFTYKRMRTVPWVLVAALPADEAFAPIEQAQRRIVLITLLIAALLAPVVWVGTGRMLRPLLDLRDTIRRVRKQPGEIHATRIERHDEIGDLAAEFDAMVRERHDADQALRESEARLRLLVDSVKDYAIFMLDAQGYVASWNEGAERIHGYRTDQIIGRHVSSFFPEDAITASTPDRLLREALQAGRCEDESWRVRRDGSRFWANMIITKLSDDNGRTVGFVTIARDLTERREAHAAVAEREARLKAFMDHSPSLMFVKDLEGRYLHVNEQFTHSFGLAAKDLIGRKDDEVLAREVAEQFMANDRKVFATGIPLEVEEGAWYTDGWHVSLVSKFPIQDGSGRTVALGGIVTDITERRSAEQALQTSEKRLRLITDNLPVMIAYIDRQERYRFINPTAERWFGVSPAEHLGRTVREVRGENGYAVLGEPIRRALAGEAVAFHYEYVEGGVRRHLDIRFVPDIDGQGQCEGLYIVANDITEMKLAEQTLRESEARFRAMGDASPLGIFVTDRDGHDRYVNDQYCRITGVSSREALGQGWSAHIHPDDRDAVVDAWHEAVRSGLSYEGEYRFVRRDGVVVWVQVKANAFFEDGKALGYVGTVEDITRRKEAEQRLVRLAHIDPLTGLPNRSLFNDRLGTALARRSRSGRPVALMYLDIDRFKSINDSLGHAAGDVLLKAFGERLKRTVRATDTVARLGGDEFVIILEELQRPEDVRLVAQKIVEIMEEPIMIEGQPLVITTSIGIASSMDGDASTLLEQADQALYAAKRAGRNRYEMATAG